MDSSTKHRRDGWDAEGGERKSKKAKPSSEAEPSAAAVPLPVVELNPADCNLDFDVGSNGLEGQALYESGFAYCWSGARATIGIVKGKYCFGCKIISEQKVDMEDTPPDQQHLCRVGISRGDDLVGSLGETTNSFGFGGTGKFSTGGKFSDYGTKFGVGDNIVCAVDFENKPVVSIGFSKNGKWLGRALQFNIGTSTGGEIDPLLQKRSLESAYFPHVLLKNVVVQMQFSTDDGLVPEDGYKPWSSALEDGNAISGPHFMRPEECEVLMMVGLPASGKSTWAEKWIRDRPEKRYILLGTNIALDQMKVPGLLRQKNYGERFEHLMDRATVIFNTLLTRAAKTPRNFILDQTNVYKSARRRKIKEFANFRKIAVVIFPTPDQLKIRATKRFKEMGKEVPAEAVNEMLANYVLPSSKDVPGSNELFDQVIFPELGRVEAQNLLDEMKQALRTARTLSKCSDSPYSRDGSFPLSADSCPHFPLPDKALGIPLQVHQSYGGPRFNGTPGSSARPMFSPSFTRPPSRPGDPSTSLLRDDPYRKYSDTGRFPYPRNDSVQFSSYGGTDSLYGKPSSERDSMLHLNPCGGYGENWVENHFNYEKRSPMRSLNYQSSSKSPFASPGAPSTGARLSAIDHSVGRPLSEQQGSLSGSSTYRSLNTHYGEPQDCHSMPSFSRGPFYGTKDPFPSHGSNIAPRPHDSLYGAQLNMQGSDSRGHQGPHYGPMDPLPNQRDSYAINTRHSPSYGAQAATWGRGSQGPHYGHGDLFPRQYGSHAETTWHSPYGAQPAMQGWHSQGRQGPHYG